jgi:predicted ATPase
LQRNVYLIFSMFNSLQVDNFKCLQGLDLSLGAITLLTGLNAAGKSSVVQALALLRQTACDNEWSKSLQLNGSSVHLGTMYDVIDRNSGGSGFRIKIRGDGWGCEWGTTSEDRNRDLVAQLSSIKLNIEEREMEWLSDDLRRIAVHRLIPELIAQTDPFVNEKIQFEIASISYIGAERVGPREVYAAQTPTLFPDVGAQGEKTPWCLEQFADAEINPSLALSGVPQFVRQTVTAWMGQLFPGFDYEIKRVSAANLLTMGIRTTPRGDFFRPMNVGFGITHILPVFAACISAKPGRLIIVENPETHLHPAGQSLVGYFLGVAAASGVQILVETHSDHVLNGVRRAVRDQRLSADAVKIYFFSGEAGEGGDANSKIDCVGIDPNGRLSGWPVGFFDQLEADLDYLFRE